jgi:c-di-GMP-binding flagellar brake protein YcgR
MDPSPSKGAERRQYIRFAPPIGAELQVPRKLLGAVGLNRGLNARIMDLSEGGAGLFVAEQIEKGTVIKIHIEFKDLNDVLDISGTVVRCTPPPPIAGAKEWIIGVEFADVSRELKKKIDSWRLHVSSTMVRRKTEERRRELGLGGPPPDGIQ